jgi:hypothetical protein
MSGDFLPPSPPAEKATNSRIALAYQWCWRPYVYRAENISSALKRRMNVCQGPSVSELLGSLVTEFVRDFSGEDATPIQLGSHRGLLDDI